METTRTWKTTEELKAILTAAGIRVTKRTTIDTICDAIQAAGVEFWYEYARELKAEILTGKVA
jgi:hypothetical protein